jgi:hypothetical protein
VDLSIQICPVLMAPPLLQMGGEGRHSEREGRPGGLVAGHHEQQAHSVIVALAEQLGVRRSGDVGDGVKVVPREGALDDRAGDLADICVAPGDLAAGEAAGQQLP